MDNNNQQNQYGSQNQFGASDAGSPMSSQDPSLGQQQGVPPPPSPNERISVRTMTSDVQSVRETGGQMPQSQIVDAPQIPSMTADAPSFSSPEPATTSTVQGAQETNAATSPMGAAPISTETVPMSGAVTGSGSKIKTISMIGGAVIIALALGFGAYYLVTSLVSSSPSPVATSSNSVLPTAPTASSVPAPQPTVISPMTHVSLLLNPTQTGTVTMSLGSDPALIRMSIAGLGTPRDLSVGGIRDIAMVDASSSPIKGSTILPMYFPSFGASLGSMVEPDFTSWFYLDKTGGSKLGFVFKLTPAAQSATTTIAQYIESNPADLANLFLVTSTVPKAPTFKDGQVNGVRVRFLAYNAKAGRIIEYGFMPGLGGSMYLILATSYNQMVDVIGRLKANPSVVPASSASPTATSSTSSPR